MRKTIARVFVCALIAIGIGGVALAGPVGSPTNWDATAIHWDGPTRAGAINMASGNSLCLDGTGCTKNLQANGAYLYYTSANHYLSGDVQITGAVSNPSASTGGSIAVNDPIRNLNTTTALFESSTSATAGVDTGFTFNTLATLASPDFLLNITNNGAAAFKLRNDGRPEIASNSIYFPGSSFAMDTAQYGMTYDSAGYIGVVAGIKGTAANSATAVALDFKSVAYTTVGSKIATFSNNTSAKASIDKDGIISGYPVVGGLYAYELASALTLTTSGTYVKFASTTAGTCQGLVCSTTTDDVSLPNEARFAGIYLVTATTNINSTEATAQVIEMKIFKEGVGQDNCATSITLTSATGYRAMSVTCFINAIAEDSIDLRYNNRTSSGKTITVDNMNLTMYRVN